MKSFEVGTLVRCLPVSVGNMAVTPGHRLHISQVSDIVGLHRCVAVCLLI